MKGVTMDLTEKAKAFAFGFTKPCIRVFAASQNSTSSKVRFYASPPGAMRYFIMDDADMDSNSFKQTRALRNKNHFTGVNTALACAIEARSASSFSESLVTCLLENRADPNIRDQRGDSVIALALAAEAMLPPASTAAQKSARRNSTKNVIDNTNLYGLQSTGQTELDLAVKHLNHKAVDCILAKMHTECDAAVSGEEGHEIQTYFKDIHEQVITEASATAASETNASKKQKLKEIITTLKQTLSKWAV